MTTTCNNLTLDYFRLKIYMEMRYVEMTKSVNRISKWTCSSLFFWVLHNKIVWYCRRTYYKVKLSGGEAGWYLVFFFYTHHRNYTRRIICGFFLQIETSNSNQMLCNTNSRQESLIHIKRMSCEMSNNTQRIILENDVVPTEYKRMPNTNPLLMKKKLKKQL